MGWRSSAESTGDSGIKNHFDVDADIYHTKPPLDGIWNDLGIEQSIKKKFGSYYTAHLEATRTQH